MLAAEFLVFSPVTEGRLVRQCREAFTPLITVLGEGYQLLEGHVGGHIHENVTWEVHGVLHFNGFFDEAVVGHAQYVAKPPVPALADFAYQV